MSDLLKELKAHHTVSFLKGPFRGTQNFSIIEDFMRKQDVLYVEFCASNMVFITNVPKHCKIVCRLHRAEVHGRWMRKVNFKKIDLLILVNKFMKGYAFRYQPSLRQAKETKVIQLGVDVEKFNYNPLRGYGKRIGWVGFIKELKKPDLVLKMMTQLPDWQLRLLAVPSVYKHVTRRVVELAKQQRNVVWIKNKIPHDKMPRYYSKLDVFVNTSTIESQCVSVLEAMSCGVYSLIRRWPHPQCHPEQIYPRKNLFADMQECKRKIWSWVKLSFDEKRAISRKMRQFVVKRHNIKDNVRKMRKAIETV
ncbi:hypothetical protein ES702_00739 [subsurface metagenome]